MFKLKSTNPKFSYVLCKNPETQRSANVPFEKGLRQGKLYGWYTTDQEFKAIFIDKTGKSSFSTCGDFEYLDRTRYTSSYLPIAIITEFFRSATRDVMEEDTPADHELEVVVELASKDYALRTQKLNPNINIEFDFIGQRTAKVKFSVQNNTLNFLFNGAISYLIIHAISDERNYIPADAPAVLKYVRALNSSNAPYDMRHILSMRLIRSPNVFKAVKEELDNGMFDINFAGSQEHRFDAISKRLSGHGFLHDIGCGELYYAKRLVRLYDKVHAYDVAEIQESNEWFINKRNLQDKIVLHTGKVEVFEQITDPDKTDILITEVLEHMELEEAQKLMTSVLTTSFRKVIATVPNREFNVFYGMEPGEMRHDDHHYEPSFDEFFKWCESLAEIDSRITFEVIGIGDAVIVDGKKIHSSTMAIFKKANQ